MGGPVDGVVVVMVVVVRVRQCKGRWVQVEVVCVSEYVFMSGLGGQDWRNESVVIVICDIKRRHPPYMALSRARYILS